MGVPTWVVIPILPYYLWALPGSSVPWYDAVRLFRQDKYDTWEDVFESIRTALGGYLNRVQRGRIGSYGLRLKTRVVCQQAAFTSRASRGLAC